jgi:hypothetical protein
MAKEKSEETKPKKTAPKKAVKDTSPSMWIKVSDDHLNGKQCTVYAFECGRGLLIKVGNDPVVFAPDCALAKKGDTTIIRALRR